MVGECLLARVPAVPLNPSNTVAIVSHCVNVYYCQDYAEGSTAAKALLEFGQITHSTEMKDLTVSVTFGSSESSLSAQTGESFTTHTRYSTV